MKTGTRNISAILLLSLLFSGKMSHAQGSEFPSFTANLNVVEVIVPVDSSLISGDSLSMSLDSAVMADTINYNVTLNVHLTEITDIAFIKVTLKKSEGSPTEMLSQIFNLKAVINADQDASINLGVFHETPDYYCEVRLQRMNRTLSAPAIIH